LTATGLESYKKSGVRLELLAKFEVNDPANILFIVSLNPKNAAR
jgi:hypothetical protein